MPKGSRKQSTTIGYGTSGQVILDAVTKAGELTGSAGAQVDAFAAQAAVWSAKVPESAQIKPGRIL